MKNFIKLLIALGFFGILIFIALQLGKTETIYNQGYVNGNTSGNLYNGGYFCEIDGKIFFSNPSDGGKLYSMDAGGGNLKKINNDVAAYINADENYIYYVRNNSGSDLNFNYVAFHRNALVRIDHDGSNLMILDTEPSLYAALLGNYIYYIHYDQKDASTLYKVRIDGTEQQQVMKDAVFTCNAEGQYFYYNGMRKDGSIHRFDTATDTSTTVYIGNSFQPIVSDGSEMYFIDGNNNYAIVHTNLNFDNPTFITRDSVDAYNVYGSYIYYQRYSSNGSAFCMIKNDGTEQTVILEGDYCDIHVTSHFVFVRDYHSGEMFYFPRNNPSEIARFNPGTLE